MAIDELKLILTARELLTELPESVHYSRENLRQHIKPAISIWQQDIAKDRAKRHAYLVESADIPISNGLADIGAEVDAKGYRLDLLEASDIVMAYSAANYTVKFVNSFNRLVSIGRQDKFFILAYLDGTKLTFRIISVVMPNDLTDIPAAELPALALIMATLAKQVPRQQNRGLDVPAS